MAQTLTTQSSSWKPKRTVLLVAALFSVALGPLIVLPNETSPQYRIIRFATLVCVSLLVLAWCYFDSLERHQSFYSWLRIVILIFGLFALFIYLFKSRGFKQGMRSSGIALLSLLGLFVILLASASAYALVFGID
jgi:cytochrome bd-type quinol oxidase subunit 2